MRFAGVALLGCAAMLSAGPRGDRDGDNDDRRGGHEREVLRFETMAGVPRPYTGATNAIRGVAGGGLPWVVERAKGKLHADGRLEIEVKGLVLDPNDPAVIQAGRAGQNPIASFAAIVSCLSRDAAGAPTTVNLMTQAFPATTGPASAGGGNARIEAFLQMPEVCIAPVVFVTSPTGAWFAATGR